MALKVTKLSADDPSECYAKHLDEKLSIILTVMAWCRGEPPEVTRTLMSGTAREVIDHLIHEHEIMNDDDEPYYYAQTDAPSDILAQLLEKLNEDDDTFELTFM